MTDARSPEQATTSGAEPRTRSPQGWRYAESGKRDLRLDFLRGFAVFAMVTDHIAGHSWLYNVTGGNRFVVSAAEGFVFISGVVVGIVYGGLALKEGVGAAVSKLLQRAWLLYVLAVWLTIGAALVATILDNPIGVPFAQAPARFIFETITLRRTFYLVDVLLLYLFVMIAATGAIAALRQGWWWLVALASWGLWGAYQVDPAALRLPWSITDNVLFNFAPWQVLFFTGLILGYYRQWLATHVAARWPGSPLRDGYIIPLGLIVGALVWLSATNAAVFNQYAPNHDAATVFDAWFDKSALPLPRLLACLALFAFAWAVVTRCWRPLRACCGSFLLVLGQGALYAYAVHIFLAALVQFAAVQVWGPAPDGKFPHLHPGVNTLIQIGALALLWSMTRHRFLQIDAATGRWRARTHARLAGSRWVASTRSILAYPTLLFSASSARTVPPYARTTRRPTSSARAPTTRRLTRQL